MPKKAAPFKQAGGWAMRRRVDGQEFYVSDKASAAAAEKEMATKIADFEEMGVPLGLGPSRTTVAQALMDYGVEHLPFLKGADQESRRINAYLRAAGLSTLKVVKVVRESESEHPVDPKKAGQYFEVSKVPPEPKRVVPNGLGEHRQKQAKQTAAADAQRRRIARMAVSGVQPYHLQELVNELRKERSASTVQLERALLRAFFNHVRHVWRWAEPRANPAVRLKMPRADNSRDRVMSLDEQGRLDEVIQACRNQLVGPTLTLLRETAMRTSEPLEYACWSDVDWEANILRLRDSKTDQREVPLSPAAIKALRQLAELNPPTPKARIVKMSYNALAAAWRRSCERAGLENLHLHDLRHTAATRMALKTGNAFIVKALTGHKTLSQLDRYVNVTAADVVAVMHAAEPNTAAEAVQPTRYVNVTAADVVALMHTAEPTKDRHAVPAQGVSRPAVIDDTVGNLVTVDFRAKRSA
jgi:integrase